MIGAVFFASRWGNPIEYPEDMFLNKNNKKIEFMQVAVNPHIYLPFDHLTCDCAD